MKELELEVARYVGRHPYKATRLDEGDPKVQPWRWILTVTEQPPDSIAIVLGDVLTNLRAALDHIAAALSPGNDKHYFPLEVNAGEEGRVRFARATKGMSAAAIAFIEQLQPYNFPPTSPEGRPQIHPIRELGRLVNADKHDGLIPLKMSLFHSWSLAMVVSDVGDGRRLGGVVNRGWYGPEGHDEGHTVADMNFNPAGLRPGDEMQVHIHGTPRVSVKIVDGYGHNEILELVRIALDTVRTDILPALEAEIPL